MLDKKSDTARELRPYATPTLQRAARLPLITAEAPLISGLLG